jgi:DNA-binding transcriptional MerR regulator
MMKFLTIGELAAEVGLSVDSIRKAEAEGRIPRARRTLGGWRVYTPEEVEKLRTLLISEAGSRTTLEGEKDCHASL